MASIRWNWQERLEKKAGGAALSGCEIPEALVSSGQSGRRIISRIITFTENMAVVEARIYLDKCDQEDNYVANSFSQNSGAMIRSLETNFWKWRKQQL